MFLSPYSSILEHPQIIKYFKGVYNLRPPTQKTLFDCLSHEGKNDQLSDKILSQKLLIFLLLLACKRMNAVYLLTVDRITVTDIGVKLSPSHVL